MDPAAPGSAAWLRRVPLVDGHNDYPWAHRICAAYDLDKLPFDAPTPQLHTDLPRLRSGGVGAQFWSVFVPSRLTGESAVTATLEQIAFVRRLVERHPETLALATCGDGVDEAVASGRIASLLGAEGGHSINCSLDVLAAMHALGVRYLTLTHNDNIPWADSATDEPVLGGLSDFGHRVVAQMNRLGMLVDLSHVSADVMRQALATSSAPVIFSHSNARAVCDVARNVPDDVLERVPANGGVVMATFVPMFVSPPAARWYVRCRELAVAQGLDPKDFAQLDPVMRKQATVEPPPVATVDQVVAHIEHIRDVAGVAAVGIGGDFDGTAFVTQNLEDVSCYPTLFAALAARRWSAKELAGLAGGNVLRVLRAAEEVAHG